MPTKCKRRTPIESILLVLAACILPFTVAAFDLQGHRGARGLAPENTVEGFAKALTIGVTTLELDTVVTADGVVVVSHNAKLDPNLTRDADGRWLGANSTLINTLKHADLSRYDVGKINPESRYAKHFPDQKPVNGARIPALAEIIALTRRAKNGTVQFNIETKINPFRARDTPAPGAFVDALLEVIRTEDVADRTIIQSFDWRTLVEVRKKAPAIRTACLTAEQKWLDNVQRNREGPSPWTAGFDIDDEDSVPHLVWRAGCKIWSPFHGDLTAANIGQAKSLGLQVIPWTVNEKARMGELIDLGIDGAITDYPDRLRAVMESRGMSLPPVSKLKTKS